MLQVRSDLLELYSVIIQHPTQKNVHSTAVNRQITSATNARCVSRGPAEMNFSSLRINAWSNCLNGFAYRTSFYSSFFSCWGHVCWSTLWLVGNCLKTPRDPVLTFPVRLYIAKQSFPITFCFESSIALSFLTCCLRKWTTWVMFNLTPCLFGVIDVC